MSARGVADEQLIIIAIVTATIHDLDAWNWEEMLCIFYSKECPSGAERCNGLEPLDRLIGVNFMNVAIGFSMWSCLEGVRALGGRGEAALFMMISTQHTVGQLFEWDGGGAR